MDKSTRATLIRSRWHAIAGVALGALGMIQPSRAEVQTEAHRITATSGNDDEIRDESIVGVVSQLHFDSERIHVSEKDSLLTAQERKQLARDLARRNVLTLHPAQ